MGQCNLLRGGKGVHNDCRNYFVHYISHLCGVWWCSNTISLASTFPKWRKAPLEKYPLSQKKKLISRILLHGITQNKIPKWLNFNCPHRCILWRLWANWERLWAKYGRLHCKIFQSEQTNLHSSSANVNSFPLSGCPQRRSWRRKKNTFSAVEDFTSFWWHSGTQKLTGRAKQKQILPQSPLILQSDWLICRCQWESRRGSTRQFVMQFLLQLCWWYVKSSWWRGEFWIQEVIYY